MSKLSDAASEAAETQTWIRFAVACGYWAETIGNELSGVYDNILGKLVRMIVNPDQRLLKG